MPSTTTLADLAGEAYEQFETAKRADGETFTRLKSGAEPWLTDLVYNAHDQMLPEDWRYESIQSALGAIHDAGSEDVDDLGDVAHEWADSNVDVYNGARVEWLGSSIYRAAYVDQARKDGLIGPDTDLYDQLGIGQYVESLEIFESVRQSLADQLEAD